MSEEEAKDRRNEEIRALFVLGLLAVLASIRTQNPELTVTIGQVTIPIIPIIDIMLILWSFYALFMVIGFSEDMFGKMVAKSFRYYAKLFLALNFVILVAISFLYALAVYQNRFLWAIGLFAIPLAYYFYDKFKKMKKNAYRFGSNLTMKDIVSVVSAFGLVACFWLIFQYPSEQLIPIFFVVGAIFMILSLYLNRDKE